MPRLCPNRTRIDLIVPIAMTIDREEALLALGANRSQEPYTRDDRNLLAAIASNFAPLLERAETLLSRPREEFEEYPQCGACYDRGAGIARGRTLRLRPATCLEPWRDGTCAPHQFKTPKAVECM